MNTRQLNTVWAILLVATLATWTIGEVGEHLGIAGPPAMLTLLAISFVKGRLVVKLTEERARQMCDAGIAVPFDPGHGRKMKQWVSLPVDAGVDWIELSREAMQISAADQR